MLYTIVGSLLIAIVGVDVFYTVFSNRGGGWLTNLWTSGVWSLLLRIHRRFTTHRLLAFAGPGLLLSIVLIWYSMLVIGWACLYASTDTSVINSDKQFVTSFDDKVFFVGVTLSTLGYGNMVPNGVPWTYLGNITALSGTVLLTASLTYVLAVLQASIERRQLATMINTIGTSTEEFLSRTCHGVHRSVLDSHLLTIANHIDNHAHKHVNYPILRFFHTGQWRHSPAPALLVFSDSIFLASHAIAKQGRPPECLLHVCGESVANYLDQSGRIDRTLGSSPHPPGGDGGDADAEAIPAHISLEVLHRLQIPTVQPGEFVERYKAYAGRRRKMLELTRQDGWDFRFWPPTGSETDVDPMQRQRSDDCGE